jgi:hypothetical protein
MDRHDWYSHTGNNLFHLLQNIDILNAPMQNELICSQISKLQITSHSYSSKTENEGYNCKVF